MNIAVLAWVIAVGLSAEAASRQPKPPPVPLVGLAGQVDLVRVIDLAADRLSLRIDYDAKAVSGSVTLRDKGGLSDADLWSFLNEQLAAKDLTTVRAVESKGFSVVKIPAAAQSTRAVQASSVQELRESLGPAPWPGFVVVQATARNRKAAALVKALQATAGKTATGSVAQLAETDMVSIADLRPRVEDTLVLLALLDQPIETVLDEYEAVNLTPSALVQQAKELAAKRDAVSGEKTPGEILALFGKPSVQIVAPASTAEYWRTLLERLDRAGTLVETKSYAPRVFPAKDVAKLVEQVVRETPSAGPAPSTAGAVGGERSPSPIIADTWRLVIDDLTGTLIITATAAQHERVKQLMDRLDATPADTSQQVRTFTIRNRAVKEVADALGQLLDGAEGEIGSEGAKPSGTPPAASQSPGERHLTPGKDRTTHHLRVSVDEGRNALVAVGEPRILDQAEALLKSLDVRQLQVMVEVVLISLSEGQSRALGVELQKLGSLNHNAIQLSSIFGSASSGSPGTTPGLGFTGAVLNPGDFTAVLKAFEAVNDGRSTSIPRVLVGNNQDATFNSVAQQPTSTVSTNTTSTTVTGFGGFQDAGTKIKVKPQIADGDRLVLTYNVELSSFTSKPEGGLPGAKQQNTVTSVATIPDGHTIVVGGIELTTETDDESRVPILGSLPVIGGLFKSHSTTRDRTRFFVFIRANVMRDGQFEDLKYVSTRASEALDVAEGSMGHGEPVDTGTPKVEPRIIR